MKWLWVVGWLLGGGWAMPCEDAHLKCAYRAGCGLALQQYMMSCSELDRHPEVCPERCQHALIALMSTNEGKQLMTCECRDEKCRHSKERVEVCRPLVQATHNASVVTCVVAQWICSADTLCSTALKYYHTNCRSMFQGKRCSPRCKNSINILRRQEKAAKLDSCICNGREEYDCLSIRRNMERMCFQKKPSIEVSTEIPPEPGSAVSSLPHSLLLLLSALLCYR